MHDRSGPTDLAWFGCCCRLLLRSTFTGVALLAATGSSGGSGLELDEVLGSAALFGGGGGGLTVFGTPPMIGVDFSWGRTY